SASTRASRVSASSSTALRSGLRPRSSAAAPTRWPWGPSAACAPSTCLAAAKSRSSAEPERRVGDDVRDVTRGGPRHEVHDELADGLVDAHVLADVDHVLKLLRPEGHGAVRTLRQRRPHTRLADGVG